MKRTTIIATLCFVLGFHASASEFSYDFSDVGEAGETIPAFAVGDKLLLGGPDDVSFSLDIVSAPPAGIAGQSFIAKDGATGAGAVVKAGVGKLRITVDDFAAGKIYTFVVKDGKKSFSSLDKVKEPDECATCAAAVTNEVADVSPAETPAVKATRKSSVLKGTGSEFPLAAQKDVVDILVAFDKGAKAWAENGSNWGGRGDSIEEFADYAVNKMNMVLEKSRLLDTFSYRLAGVTEVDATYTSIGNQLLGNLRARVGALSRLTQLREKCGADTITLLIDKTQGNTTGIGYGYYPISSFPGPASFDGMNYACNVCDIKTVYSRYTMSHETGHNMGCDHSTRQGPTNSGPGRFEDSSGYHFVDTNGVRRYTIMGYNYTDDDDYNYSPVPYFSSPDISPDEYGCAVGVEGTNNNRRTLLQTHGDIAGLREHVLPYDWDVRFLDDNGNDIADGGLFYTSCNVTLTNSNPEAEIYYTLDGSAPTSESLHGGVGTKVNMYLVYGPKTLTACAVVDGKAQSVRSITLYDGLTWSGDANGNGLWLNNDSYVLPWTGNSYFSGDAVMFPDLAGVSCATVTVKGAVAPSSVAFSSIETAYAFDGGDDDAKITIPNANFAPSGDVTFNVPVQISATTFTNLTGSALTFNTPFGQTVDATSGYCTNLVTILPYGTMTVAPGAGKTQTFDTLNNQNGGFSGNATFRVGVGKVIFKGSINSGAGVIGRTKLEVANGGELVFNVGGGTGFDMNNTSLTIEKGGVVTFNDMEHLRRALHLGGGTINAKRLDLMSDPGVYVTDDSSIENAGDGYILIRKSDSEINVYNGTCLTLNVGTQAGNTGDTSGWGIIKRGSGTLVANVELKHSGVTDIESGSLEVGYSSGSTIYGQEWIVAEGSALKVKSGCTLKTPTLTLDGGATISVSGAVSAPIIATNNVSVSGVYFELAGADNLAAGASYPLLKGNDGISGSKDAKTSSLPALASGLKWKLEVADNTLYAKVVEKSELDGAVAFTSNDPSLALVMPSDATLAEGGGVAIAASPIVVNGTLSKAVSVAVRFVVPETSPSTAATICSLNFGGSTINCMRAANGEFNCYFNGLQYSASLTSTVALTVGEHLLQIGYYAERDVVGEMGTRVLLDGNVVYYGSGLKFSDYPVSRVAFGATAEDTSRYPYAGLVILETGIMNVRSSVAPPRMTSSGGETAYSCFVTNAIPRVFPLTPRGAIALDETVVEATFSKTPGEASVSVMTSFPSDKVGTICGMWVQQGAAKCGLQAEYDGSGKFYIRNSDNSLASYPATRLAETSLDVSKPHLYTLTFKSGDGVTFYQDGVALLKETSLFSGYNTVISPVTFGCGPYHLWRGSPWHEYPNPAKDFSLLASHIALGTSDRTVSEEAVMASMATDEEDDDPKPPATPATVDVLVAYDNGAQTYVANRGVTLSEFAATQIEKMNAVLATNRLDRYYAYRLAGVCKVDGVYNNIDTAPALIAAGTGAAVSLRAARELYGADTVTLLVDVTGNTLGNSSPLNYPNDVASQHECAFSVCSIRAVDTGKQHTMIHENAHNMGCGHARAQSIINSPFEYGRGFYFQDGNVTHHTIMAYGSDNDASWYFSTTSKEFGFVLGDKTNNNARVLKETCAEVSKWRDGAAIDLDGSFATGDAVWQTGRKYPWSLEGDAIRSFNQTNYQYQCTTPLKATITGPKTLYFKHRSYFGGESVAGNNYSHFDVLLDDSSVLTQTECTNSWTDAQVKVPRGTHEVVFVFSQRFAMNNSKDYKGGTPEDDDAVWIKDIRVVEKRIRGAAAIIR